MMRVDGSRVKLAAFWGSRRIGSNDFRMNAETFKLEYGSALKSATSYHQAARNGPCASALIHL